MRNNAVVERRLLIMCWAGRCCGGIAVALWLGIGIASALVGDDPWLWESTVLALLWLFAAVGYVLAWRRTATGGRLLLVAGLAYAIFAAFTASRNHALAMLISGGPFLLAGGLFILSKRLASAGSDGVDGSGPCPV